MPVIATVDQALRHVNSVFADETCAEEDGLSPVAHRGGFVVADGWDE